MLQKKGYDDASQRAARAIVHMRNAFDEAMVVNFESCLRCCENIPDPNDSHVLAAAIKT